MRTVSLGELCDIRVGRTPARATPEYWGSGTPWLSIADMNQGLDIRKTKEQITSRGEWRGGIVEPGTVLLSFKLSVGKVAIARVPLFTNEAIAALSIKQPEQLDSRYLLRALQSMNLAASSNRAAMGATLNKAQLVKIPISLPSIEEQRRAAALLDQADSLRIKRSQVLARIDSLSRSVFESLIRSASWPTMAFDALCDRLTVGVVVRPASYYVSSGVPALRTLNVKEGWLDLTDLVYFAAASSDGPLAKSRLRTGDLLIARTGNAGTAAVVPPALDGANAIDLIVATIRSDRANPVYVEKMLNSPVGKRLVRSESRGQVQQHFNLGALRRSIVPVPPLSVQQEFVDRIRGIDAQRARVERALAADRGLFASLQHRAFRSEL